MSDQPEQTPGGTPLDRQLEELIAEPAAAPAAPQRSVRLVHIDDFEAPLTLSYAEHVAYLRRFVTLFADEARTRRGGIGRVMRVTNAQGEAFALKTLIIPERTDLESDEEHALLVDTLKRAFRQEYDSHRALTGFRGFPRLYGFGSVDGVPAIVMEWIEGETLAQARLRLAVDDAGRLSPLTAARIGRDLFDLLARMDYVADGFVHRDISLGNVMVRTGRLSVEQQADEGAFDLCLIDFGSSSPVVQQGTSFTAAGAVTRKATADYAPPEMLTDDAPDLDRLRKSPAIDVYAAGSVLYQLACGTLPFDLAAEGEDGRSPYRVKTDDAPAPPVLAHAPGIDLPAVLVREPEVAVAVGHGIDDLPAQPPAEEVRDALDFVDRMLAELISGCLQSAQADRPQARDAHAALSSFALRYAENVGRSLHGEPLISSELDGRWGVPTASPLGARSLVRSVGRAASAAVWAVVLVATALLMDGSPAALHLGSFTWQGAVPGGTVAGLLALPAIAGTLVRWNGARTLPGFVRGTAALLVAALAVLGLALNMTFVSDAKAQGLFAALFAAAAAGWCPLVLDFALSVAAPHGRPRQRTGLPAPPGAGYDALPDVLNDEPDDEPRKELDG